MAKSVYFIGIKGVGMTSLALCMQDEGWLVSGSDSSEHFITDPVLTTRGIPLQPLDAPPPPGVDFIIHSAAYSPPATQVKTLPLAAALAEFVKDKQVIAVAGVGGKTTTSAMLAAMFHAANRDVGYYVGTSSIAGLPAPGHRGTDSIFIVEADEYAVSQDDHRPKFALLTPQIVVTTNIIHDHPDIYPDQEATLTAFSSLIASIPAGGTWVCRPADPLTAKILRLQGLTLKDIKIIQYGSGHLLSDQLKLSVFGNQNKLDALAAVLAGISAGLTEVAALKGIKSYRGAGRRQELHGEIHGRLLYDDYGHHPEEIMATVKAFKDHFPTRRLILVFESHTYSRTEALLPEFAQALALADATFIMPIFESAREQGQSHSVTPASLAAIIPGAATLTWDNAAQIVWAASRPGDLILTMGAGFVYKLHDQFKLK